MKLILLLCIKMVPPLNEAKLIEFPLPMSGMQRPCTILYANLIPPLPGSLHKQYTHNMYAYFDLHATHPIPMNGRQQGEISMLYT